jgi:hypothetical protein
VTHAFPNTRVDERGLVALLGIVCRVIRRELCRKHDVFSIVIIFLVNTERYREYIELSPRKT